MKALVLPLGEEHYGFPLTSVQQVISDPRVTRLPVADEALLGLVNVRGEIVPLFDLAVLAGTGRKQAATFAILVSTSLGTAALGVELMPESLEIDEDLASDGEPDAPRVYPVGGRLVTLLEVEKLLVTGRAVGPRAN
jgi:purine-binding chemotaxis protein CheW